MGSDPGQHRRLEEQISAIDGVITAAVVPHAIGSTFEVQVYTDIGVSDDFIRRQIAGILAAQGRLQDVEAVHVFVLWAGVSEEQRRERLFAAGEEQAAAASDLPVLDVPAPAPVGAMAGAPGTGAEEGPDAAGPQEPGSDHGPAPADEAPRPTAPTDGGDSAPGARRPRLARIRYQQAGESSEASVALRVGDREVEGVGRGRATPYALRVAAATALEAAQAVIGEKGWLQLEGVSLMRVFNRQAVLVLVHSTKDGGSSLLGAALVGDGPPYEAAVKAALDAVNRQLEVMLSG